MPHPARLLSTAVTALVLTALLAACGSGGGPSDGSGGVGAGSGSSGGVGAGSSGSGSSGAGSGSGSGSSSGSGTGTGGAGATGPYTISGTITGLTGSGLTLQLNGINPLSITTNTPFTFQPAIATGAPYAVSILQQPANPEQLCTIANATGSVGTSNISNVAITCQTPIPRYAYAVNSDNTIATYSIDPTTGQLRARSYRTSGASPLNVTLSPNGSFAYVVNSNSASGTAGSVSIYSVAADGTLAEISASPVPTAINPTTLAFTPDGRFAYVNNLGSNTVSMFSADPRTGALTAAAGGSVATGSGPISVSIDPKGRFAYVTNNTDNTISAYRIDATTGGLTELAGPRARTGIFPELAAIDPSGQFVYVPNFNVGTVSMFAINSDGSLTPIGSGTVAAGDHPDALAFDRSGQHVYVTNRVGKTASVYSLNSTSGNLTLVDEEPVTSGNPLSINIDPTGAFAYIRVALPNTDAQSRHANALATYSIDTSTGKLTAASSLNLRGDTSSPAAVAISRGTTAVTDTPQWAYVLNKTNNTISAFTLDSTTGSLSSAGPPVATGGVQPTAVVIHPSGKSAYAVNGNTSTIATFSIAAATGQLTLVGTPIAAGTNLNQLQIDPSGRFLYVPSQGALLAFSIDPASGALTPIPMSPARVLRSAPLGIAIDPTGRFVYVANSLENTVAGFVIDAASGIVNSLGSDFVLPAGASPRNVTIDPTGRFLYVANSGTSNVSVFAIDPGIGILMPVSAPVATGGSPNLLTLDVRGRFAYISTAASSNIEIFPVDPLTGQFGTPLSPAPLAGQYPIAAAFDPSSRFVYVANTLGTVSAFAVDPASGVLSALAGSPFVVDTAGVDAISVWGYSH